MKLIENEIEMFPGAHKFYVRGVRSILDMKSDLGKEGLPFRMSHTEVVDMSFALNVKIEFSKKYILGMKKC